MNEIKITIFHTGKVCVSPYLPFGGDCNLLQASGLSTKKKDRLWLPVSCYLIEHPKGKILVDCGWHQEMSPNGIYDKKAQIKSLGSKILYHINQGVVELGQTIDEQLKKIGIQPSDLDFVILTHLDCDHANGLELVKDAKKIFVSNDELLCVRKKHPIIQIRFQKKWWEHTKIQGFDWNDIKGPVHESYDLFGDSSVQLIHIPGHSDGLCAVKIMNDEGKYVLLYSDGGYASKSWNDMILPGISMNKKEMFKSLEWIKQQSLDENCVESLANHDASVQPHTIIL